ncbi:MAG: hypothetical protein JNJ77_17340 [Planctomycetia bacterium]|nr:hypothetical protein [Planctomycetia bacterium]
MLHCFALLMFLLFAASAWADDRKVILSDGFQEVAQPGKSVVRDVNLFRHYEGLKHFAQGRMLEHRERIPEALQAYNLATQFDGKATDLIRMMLPLCFKMEQTATALKLMRRSLEIDPTQIYLWLKLGQELHDLQRYPESLQAVEQAMPHLDANRNPAFAADLLVVQGCDYDALNQYDKAAEAFTQALKIVQDRNRYLEDPYSPPLEELPREEARLLERLARSAMKARQYDVALDACKKSHAVYDQGNDRLELNLAEVYLASGKPEAATVHLMKAVRNNPLSDEPFRLLVKAYEQSGRAAEVVPFLEQLLATSPKNTALNLVLAEQLTETQQFPQAERLYREIFTIEQAAFPDAVQGYFKLLVCQGKVAEAMTEFDQMMSQPSRARWARVAVIALLKDPAVFKSISSVADPANISSSTLLMLIRLSLQLEMFEQAEALAKQYVLSVTKPQEAFLLLIKSQLEQKKYDKALLTCQAAINHPAITQPLVFHLESAKAQAQLKQPEAALQSLKAARELCGPSTTDEHQVVCTKLYLLHVLGKHQQCLQEAEEALKTSLAQGPWARQVRYIQAHAFEATGEFEKSLHQFTLILQRDPNDGEALAAKARCLLFQNKDLKQAMLDIDTAIELDLIAQNKRNRHSPSAGNLKVNPGYQATKASILMRQGKASEASALLMPLVSQPVSSDAWVLLALGDGFLAQNKREEARQAWQQAMDALPLHLMMGTDLRSSLQTRLKMVQPDIIPASGTTTTSPIKP